MAVAARSASARLRCFWGCWLVADAHHDRAKAAGADIVVPLKDMDYGSREYSVRDPGGHLWGFGTYDMAGKETGEPNIFIGLHYQDPRAALSWLTRVLGFESLKEVPGPDGNVMHAELQLGAEDGGMSEGL